MGFLMPRDKFYRRACGQITVTFDRRRAAPAPHRIRPTSEMPHEDAVRNVRAREWAPRTFSDGGAGGGRRGVGFGLAPCGGARLHADGGAAADLHGLSPD